MKTFIQKNKILSVVFIFISFFGTFLYVKPADIFDYSTFIPNSNVVNYSNSSAYYNPSDFAGQPFPKVSDSVNPCLDFEYNLNIGNRDYTIFGPITRLQTYLYENEYMIYPPTGLFLYYTYDGVKNFQRENGLRETGIVDKNTRETLRETTCNTKNNFVPITPVVTTQPVSPTYYCSLNNLSYYTQAEFNLKCKSTTPTDPNISYTINYNSNGSDSGSLSTSYQTVVSGSSVVLPDEGTMIKNGYTFDGWSTSPSGTNPITAGSNYTPNSNTTLYAVWTQDSGYTYTIEYDGNGATSGYPSTYTQTVNIGDSLITASKNTLTRTGYSFIGWSNDPSGSTLIGENSSYTPRNDETLYAIWQLTRTVSTTKQNNTIKLSQPYQGLYLYSQFPTNSDVSIEYTYEACLPQGYDCVSRGGQSVIQRLNTNSALIQSTDPNRTEINNLSFVITKITPITDNTYNYVCEGGSRTCGFSSTYTVTYNSNNADSGTPSVSSQTISLGGSVTLATQNTLSRNGYAFGGWSTSPSGTNPITAGSDYIPNSNTTLYAVWNLTKTTNLIKLSQPYQGLYLYSQFPTNSDVSIEYTYEACLPQGYDCVSRGGQSVIQRLNTNSALIQSTDPNRTEINNLSFVITKITPTIDSAYFYSH